MNKQSALDLIRIKYATNCWQSIRIRPYWRVGSLTALNNHIYFMTLEISAGKWRENQHPNSAAICDTNTVQMIRIRFWTTPTLIRTILVIFFDAVGHISFEIYGANSIWNRSAETDFFIVGKPQSFYSRKSTNMDVTYKRFVRFFIVEFCSIAVHESHGALVA